MSLDPLFHSAALPSLKDLRIDAKICHVGLLVSLANIGQVPKLRALYFDTGVVSVEQVLHILLPLRCYSMFEILSLNVMSDL